jgi:hypothetical protein
MSTTDTSTGNRKIYGWFDNAGQQTPTYDPPYDALCPYCDKPLHAEDVRTHNMMMQHGAVQSFFYRTHRTCDDAAGKEGGLDIDSKIWDMIEADRILELPK